MSQRANVEQLAALVAELRAERGLSMRSLARAADVDVAYVSRIENAGYDLPNPLYLQAIADALEVSPIDLFLAAGYLREQDMTEATRRRTARPTRRTSEGVNQRRR